MPFKLIKNLIKKYIARYLYHLICINEVNGVNKPFAQPIKTVNRRIFYMFVI